jgi:hypothetical protein
MFALCDQSVDRIRYFELAPAGVTQLREVVPDPRTENHHPGVVPAAWRFAGGLFDDRSDAPVCPKNDCGTATDVVAQIDADRRSEFRTPCGYNVAEVPGIRCDVAPAQEKGLMPDRPVRLEQGAGRAVLFTISAAR